MQDQAWRKGASLDKLSWLAVRQPFSVLVGCQLAHPPPPIIAEELSPLLLERVYDPEVQRMMAACQEVEMEDVEASLAAADAAVAASEPGRVAALVLEVAVSEASSATPTKALLEAVACRCGLNDEATLLAIARALPPAIAEEQVRWHQVALSTPSPVVEPQVLVAPQSKRSRLQVAVAFQDYLRRSCGWRDGERLPYRGALEFVKTETCCWPKKIAPARRSRLVRDWLEELVSGKHRNG